MARHGSGEQSFAIDEFPVMSDAAVERFSDASADAHRAWQQEALRALELEAEAAAKGADGDPRSTDQLLAALEGAGAAEREALAAQVEARWDAAPAQVAARDARAARAQERL